MGEASGNIGYLIGAQPGPGIDPIQGAKGDFPSALR